MKQGWSVAYTVDSVITQIVAGLVDGETRIPPQEKVTSEINLLLNLYV